MKPISPPKVGLIPVALAGERVDLAEQNYKKGLSKLISMGLEVIGGPSVYLTELEVMQATRGVIDSGVDCLVFMIGTWVYAPSIVSTMQKYMIPTAIWGFPEPASFSSVGANVVHGSLEELGIPHKLVYGYPEDADALDEIRLFAKAAMVVNSLTESKFGVIGGRSIGMYPSTTDPIQVKKVFGVEIEHIDQLLLVEYAKCIEKKEVLTFTKWFKSEFGRISVSEDVLFRSIRLYLGLKRIIEERGLTFIGVKCLEEVINIYSSCCLAISLLNDEGIIVSCQCDINAAISMQVLNLFSGMPVIFADVNNVNKNGVARLVNCGTMPTKLATTRNSVDWNPQYEYMGMASGACPTFCCQPGKVTFGSLARKNGNYVMQITQGEAFLQSRDVFSEVRDFWPQAFIRLSCNPSDFIQNLRSNHVVVGYGDFTQDLLEFCKLVGIQSIHLV